MQLDSDFRYVNEEFYADAITPAQHDGLLARAWRHFGSHFFRYNLGVYAGQIRRVIPLRVRLEKFALSKSQRRVLRKNEDVSVRIGPVDITPETEALFEQHKTRFKEGIPDTIYDFISRRTAEPLPCMEVRVTRADKLLAVSFFDEGDISLSSIYAMFDPEESVRSLGLLTILKEIEYAASTGKKYYYHGYAYEGESYYDYKKRLSGLEAYDWIARWLPFQGPEEHPQ